MATASSSTSADLLHASLTGNLPSDTELAFNQERERGNIAYREGRYDAALDHYTKAEVINPLSPLPPANRSIVYLKQEKWQRAREETSIALELHNALPSHLHSKSLMIKLYMRRATACTNVMLYALAVDDYQSILKIDPSHNIAKQKLQHLRQTFHIPTNNNNNNNINVTNTSNRINNTRSELFVSNSTIQQQQQSSSTKPDQSSRIRILPDNNKIKNVTQNKTPSFQTNGTSNITTRRRLRTSSSSSVMQDDTPLFSLPKHTARELANHAENEIPQSSTQFEHTWRTLRSDELAQARYLVRTTGVQRIRNGVIDACFTPEMLMRFVHVLFVALQQHVVNTNEVVLTLQAIPSIERFPLLMSFLSKEEHAQFEKLINKLEHDYADKNILEELRKAFG